MRSDSPRRDGRRARRQRRRAHADRPSGDGREGDARRSTRDVGGGRVKTYVILRRNGWRTPDDLQEAAARSRQVGDEQMPDDIRWIRSYVLAEPDGSLGTVCIYQASSEEAIRDHASRADLPMTEIL